jgi:energy-converting hydrogenase A subunit M
MTDQKENPTKGKGKTLSEANQENPIEEKVKTISEGDQENFIDVNQEKEDLKDKDNLMENENVHIDDDTSTLEKNDEYAREMEDDFRQEIAVDKEEEASSEEELYRRMKRRIVKSFRWQEDLIIPFSTELKIKPDELEEILMNRLDMSSLEALNPRFESAKYRCIKERIHSDLKLCWLADVMNLLTVDESEDIKNRITSRIVKKHVKYEEALEEGRKELVEYLKQK